MYKCLCHVHLATNNFGQVRPASSVRRVTHIQAPQSPLSLAVWPGVPLARLAAVHGGATSTHAQAHQFSITSTQVRDNHIAAARAHTHTHTHTARYLLMPEPSFQVNMAELAAAQDAVNNACRLDRGEDAEILILRSKVWARLDAFLSPLYPDAPTPPHPPPLPPHPVPQRWVRSWPAWIKG